MVPRPNLGGNSIFPLPRSSWLWCTPFLVLVLWVWVSWIWVWWVGFVGYGMGGFVVIDDGYGFEFVI